MIGDITNDNIGLYMELSQGYIVNKAPKTESPSTQRACAHNLAHYNERTCTFAHSDQAIKFYAPTLQEARTEAQRRWPDLPFKECEFCR